MGKASKKKQSFSSDIAKNKKGEPASSGHPDKEKIFFKPVFHLLIIGILGFLIYSNTFHSPFQWDEPDFIVSNPIIRDLGYFMEPSRAEGLPLYDAFKSRYIGYLSFALNYRLHGFDVLGYHVVNFIIHVVNALLVYFLTMLTFRTPFSRDYNSPFPPLNLRGGAEGGDVTRLIPLFVALIFVAHPVQTEAVTYVFQRLASLVSMFYLLSLVLYIKGRLSVQKSEVRSQKLERNQDSKLKIQSSVIWYLLSFVSAILAMKTKENALTLPVIITLYEFLFFNGPLKNRAARLAPFLLTMLIIPLTLIGTDSTAGEIISQIKDPASFGYEKISNESYLLTQFRVIITYLRLLFLPVNQNLLYDYPIYHSFLDIPVFLSFLFLASLFGIAGYLIYIAQKRRSAEVRSQKSEEESREYAVSGKQTTACYLLPTTHYRLIAFGIFWFFITLTVESSIVPIPMVIDEYRIYLPSIGFFLVVTAGVSLIFERFSRVPQIEKMAIAGLCAIILALSGATYARNILWKDKISLWEDVVRKSPSSPNALNNLGNAYSEKDMHEKAIEFYMKSIALSPSFSLAHANLGSALASIGKPDMAIEHLEKAIALNPKHIASYNNLARAYGEAGRLDKAEENYSMAITLNPFDITAYHGLGTVYSMLGRFDDALIAYNQFVALSPDNPEAYKNRGILYVEKGDFRNAGEDFQKACSLGSRESCSYLKDPRFR